MSSTTTKCRSIAMHPAGSRIDSNLRRSRQLRQSHGIKHLLSSSLLRLLARVVRKHASMHAPEDACFWSGLLNAELGHVGQ